MRPERLSFPGLQPARDKVLAALVSVSTADGDAELEQAARVLGLGKTLGAEVRRNATLPTAPTARADRIYSGVLYEALDLRSLTGAARRRATAWVAITSALLGLVRPHDAIPAYRLSGDVTLPDVGSVAAFWRQHLDDAVRQAAGKGVVVDLRSAAYAAFWRPGPELARRVVTVRVLHEVDGTRKVVSHLNKATKGRLVRTLLEDGGAPATPTRFVDHVRRLGWYVEPGRTGSNGTRLDVVVPEL